MIYGYIPLLFTIVGAKPLYVGTPPMLTGALSGLNLHHLTQSSLVGQPLDLIYKFGNLEQIGTLSKGLLASHLGGQKFGSTLPLLQHPTSLAFASPPIHHASPISYPIPMTLKEISPEKTIAGALIKQVPKLSKHPIAISFSPKSLDLSSNEQFGALGGGGVLGGGLSIPPVLSGKSFINDLGLSFEY